MSNIKSISEVGEGDVFNNILHRRMLGENKNVLSAVTGKTGSGKSYACLRIAELWYKLYFKKPFPIENICFSLEEVMRRLVHGNLPRGSIIILEEAGVSMSNLDFQSKMAKTFNYILQSFRNMNICLMVNLPSFAMLNKTARILMHYLFQTHEIRKNENKVILKPYELHFSQESGECYHPHPKIMIDGCFVSIQRLGYFMPSEELIEKYEAKKKLFVDNLSKDVLNDMENGEKRPLTPLQEQILDCWNKGITSQKDIAAKLGKAGPSICINIGFMRRKGYINHK